MRLTISPHSLPKTKVSLKVNNPYTGRVFIYTFDFSSWFGKDSSTKVTGRFSSSNVGAQTVGPMGYGPTVD